MQLMIVVARFVFSPGELPINEHAYFVQDKQNAQVQRNLVWIIRRETESSKYASHSCYISCQD